VGGKETKRIIIQVKSGHVSSRDIRDLKGVLPREKAEIGLFITLEDPTRDMNTEAVSAGSYPSTVWNRSYPRIQIRTVAELLSGKGFELPPRPGQFKQAARAQAGVQTSF
jgi:site-specific DNA-methyltransferase (adenine-specific)